MWETIQDRATQCSYYGMVIENHMHSIEPWQYSDDLEWLLKVIPVIYLLYLLCVRSWRAIC